MADAKVYVSMYMIKLYLFWGNKNILWKTTHRAKLNEWNLLMNVNQCCKPTILAASLLLAEHC